MKELSVLKSVLKKKVKITQALFVLFLITGTVSYGKQINDTKFENKGNISEGIIVGINDVKLLNYGAIQNNKGNGIFRYNNVGNSRIEAIINFGLILGEGSANNLSGNGVLVDLYPNANSYSELGELNNNGIIKGYTGEARAGSGNGVYVGMAYANQHLSSIQNIINTGIISGKTIATKSSYLGNGILSRGGSSKIQFIKNNGIIEGKAEKDNSFSGNGIYVSAFADVNSFAMLGQMENNGIIKGSSNGIEVRCQEGKDERIKNIFNRGIILGGEGVLATSISTGRGIVAQNIEKIRNSGIILGENRAINSYGDVITKIENNGILKANNHAYISGNANVENNGILAGKDKVSSTIKENNLGISLILDSNNNQIKEIKKGVGGVVTLEDGDTKTIINGELYNQNGDLVEDSTLARDSYIISNNNSYESNIINGAGINKGALVVQAETSIFGSIVNGYNTAVYLEDNAQLTATNTIFNGGGLKDDIAVIRGSIGDNVISVLGTSIINGKVELGSGNDNLTIENSVQLNGELVGGDGKDILNLGKNTVAKEDSNLNILHNISGFENINTNGNLTLFETIKVSGADNINLESGSLLLRVDPTEVDSDGKVMGHALYENNGTLTSNGGNLVIGLNGLGENAIVSMGNTKIESGVNDSWWKESDHLKTNSLVLDAKLDENGDVLITVKESIPMVPGTPIPPIEELPDNPNPPIDSSEDSLLYEKLNKIYQSIVSSGELGKLANTTLLEDKTEEASLGGLLTLLNQMYANTPYSYTLKSTRDSLKLFNDNISYLTVKPQNKEYIAQGRIINTGVRSDKRHSGKNYYGFDVGTNSYKTTTNTSGAIGSIEYGVSDKTSLGFVIGGNNQDINFKGNNKIDASSLYLGVFGKTQIDNFKLFSGVGYQYTSAEAERNVINKYDSFKGEEKYNLNSFNAFIEGKYSYDIGDNTKLEPKVKLSYYYVSQDKIDEGYNNKNITMEVDKAHSNTADLEVGVDLVKSKVLEKGKLKGIVSLGVVNTLGDHSKELKGKIKGANKLGKEFDLQGVELPRTSGKVGLNLEYERVNGMIYTAGIDFEFAKDYNRNVSLQVGVGYRF